MVATPWSKNDELFQKELNEGYAWQTRVAEFLKNCGLDPKVPELSFRKDISEVPKYSDLEDMECAGKIFEVKSRKIVFTYPGDFPYGTVLIDTVGSWNSKKRKPDAYICISTKTGAMIWLPTVDTEGWLKVQRYDKTRHLKDWFYECPRDFWKPISELVEELKKAG
jgi:hypothetical protein